MTDEEIIALYEQRNERAIKETEQKYGAYCGTISKNILGSDEDAAECVNDTLLRTWNAIPPAHPARLKLFLAKITRNLAFSRYRANKTAKRGGDALLVALHELEESVADTGDVFETVGANLIAESINRFLRALPDRERALFTDRYFYVMETKEIAKKRRLTEGHIRVILLRVRKKLAAHLQEEGWLDEQRMVV